VSSKKRTHVESHAPNAESFAPPKVSSTTALYEAYLRKRPQQSRSRAAVEAILSATVDRVTRDGDETDLTLEGIAARAGVGIGSLYEYFRDRKGLFAGVAAKVTEDNRIAFEAMLASTEQMPIRQTVEVMVDYAFHIYLRDRTIARMVSRVVNAFGMQETQTASQAQFARILADSLRKRADVRCSDVDTSAYIITSAVMGVMLSLIWSDEPYASIPIIRERLVELCSTHLTTSAP
jgi:AcrR family transcriptional regulator